MKRGWSWFKSHWRWLFGVLVAVWLVVVVARLPHMQTTTYDFDSASGYTLSDPSKIEVADDTLRLKDQGGGTHATDAPSAVTTAPLQYESLDGFIQQTAEGGAGDVGYQLSSDGVNWQYWDGDSWAGSDRSFEQSNDAATIDEHIADYDAAITSETDGSAELYTRIVLHAPTPQNQVALQSFAVTYAAVAPTITEVTPSSGPAKGGASVTIKGTNFIPENGGGADGWATVAGKTLPATLGNSQIAIIGNTIYSFGGVTGTSSDTAAIYSAPVSDPTTWTNTGKTLPTVFGASALAVIDNYIYLFGGEISSGTNSRAIYRAPVSDPTTWTNTGKTLATGSTTGGSILAAQAAIIGDKVWLFGFGTFIQWAPLSDPTTWTNTGKTLPVNIQNAQVAVIDNTIYLYGPNTNQTAIYTAPVSDPTTWTLNAKTLPFGGTGGRIVYIGDYMYMIGGATTAVMRAKVSDPLTWENTGKTIPTKLTGTSVAVIDNYVYLFGGTVSGPSTLNSISRAPVQQNRPQAYQRSWLTNWAVTDTNTDLSQIDIGGALVTNLNIIDSTTATGVTAAHPAGSVDVSFSNYDGQSVQANSAYMYKNAPVFTSVTPASATTTGGDTATITGTDFEETSTVSFDGVAAASVAFRNSTTLDVVLPAHSPGASDITITNSDGQAVTAREAFNFTTPVPIMSGVSPDSGPAVGGTAVTITGSGFYALGSYRVPITIGNSGTTLNDYSVKFTLDTSTLIAAGKLRPDGADLRVLDSDGLRQLSYWFDPATLNTAATEVWVKVPVLPPGGRTVYVSYGNASLTSQSNANAALTAVIPNALGSWTLDEAATPFKDNSGSEANLTTSSGVTASVAGKFGTAVNFGGGSGWLGTPKNNTVPKPPTQVSVEAWIKPVAANDGVMRGILTSAGDFLLAVTGNTATAGCPSTAVCLTMNVGGVTKAVSYQRSNLQANIWQHVAGTYDGTEIKLYLNGQLMATTPATGLVTYNGVNMLCVGMEADAIGCSGVSFNGLIDEPRMYSRALTQAEITALYNNYSFATRRVPSTVLVAPVPTAAVSANVGAEQVYGTSVMVNGVVRPLLAGSSATSLVVSTPAHAPGPVDVTVTNPDGKSVTRTSAFTYIDPATVKPTLTSVNPAVGSPAGGTTVTVSGSGFYTGGSYRVPVTITNPGTGQTDYQVTFMMDTSVLRAAGHMKADGSDIRFFDSDGLTPLPYWIEGAINTTNTLLWTKLPVLDSGARTIYVAFGNPLNTAKSSPTTVFDAVIPNLRAYWPMNEVSGTAVQDIASNNITATSSNSANITVGKYGYGRNFNGTTDNVNATSSNALKPTAALSIEAWFNSADVTRSGRLVSSALSSGATYGYFVGMFPSAVYNCPAATFCFGVYIGSSFKTVSVPYNTLSNNTWYHVAATYSGSALTLYLNGTSVATQAAAGALIPGAGAIVCMGSDLQTSSGCVSNASNFKGTIDEVRIYDRAITAAEVAALYPPSYATTVLNFPNNLVLRGRQPVSGISGSPNQEESFASNITFDGLAPQAILSASATSLQLKTPAHAPGDVDVVMQAPNGTQATLAAGYRYSVYGYRILNAPLTLHQGEPGTMIVQPIDELGNPVTSTSPLTINLTSNSPAGQFARDLSEDPSTRWTYGSVVLPAGASQTVFYYRDGNKGSPLITANGPLAEGSVAATQTERITSKYKLLVTGVSNPIKSGIPSSVTVQAADYQGIPLSDYSGTIRFSSTDASAALPADYAMTTDQLGVHTFVNGVTLVTQGANSCITVTDVSDPDITGSQCSITVTAPASGTPAKLKVITAPQTLSSGVASGVMTVQTQDVNNAPVPVGANTTLYLYSSSPSGEFSSDGVNWSGSGKTISIRAGTTAANYYYRDSTPGAHTITVRDDVGTGPDSGLTNATQAANVGGGTIYQLHIVRPAGDQEAGQNSGAFQVEVQDRFGNVTPAPSDLPVWLTSASASGRLSPDTAFGGGGLAELPLTIAAGNSTATFYYKDTMSGQRILVASDSSPPNGDVGLVDDSVNLDVLPGAPAAIAYTTPARQATVGAVSPVLTVRLTDQYGNHTTAAADITLYLSAAQPGASFFATDGTTPASQITVPVGQSEASFTFKQTTFVPIQTVVVSDASPADGAIGLVDASQNQTITPGTAAKLVITTPAPGPTAAGTPIGLTVTLQNQYGITIPAPSDTALYFKTTSAGSSFSLTDTPFTPVVTAVMPGGQDHLDLFYRDTLAGSATVTLADQSSSTDTGLTDSTQTIQTIAASPVGLHITTGAQTLQLGQPSAAITVRMEDQYGNAAVSAQNTTVTLATTSADGRFDNSPGGSFNGSVTSTTLPAGQSTKNFYYKDFQVGLPVITVGGTGLTDTTQTETLINGAVRGFSLSADSPTIKTGQPVWMTVKTVNNYGVVVPTTDDITVTLQTNSTDGAFDLSANGEFDGSFGTVVIPAGQDQASFFYRDLQTGSPTVHATQSGYTQGTYIFNITGSIAYQLALINPLRTTTAGATSDYLAVQLQDQYGNALAPSSAVSVTVSSSGSVTKFSTSTGGPWTSGSLNLTFGAGQSTRSFYYQDTAAGNKTLTATSSGLLDATQPTTVVPAIFHHLQFTTPPQTVVAGQPSGPLTIAGYDMYDNPRSIAPNPSPLKLSLASGSATGEFSLSQSPWAPVTELTISGVPTSVSFYYRDSKAGVPLLSLADKNGGYAGLNQTITVTAGAAAKLRFTSAPQTVAAGTPSAPIILELTDALDNPVAASGDTTVQLTASSSSGEFSATGTGGWAGSLSVQIPDGQSTQTLYYRDGTEGTPTLTAASPGLSDGTQLISIAAGAIAQLELTADTPVTAGQPTPIRIRTQTADGLNAAVASPTAIDLFSTHGGEFSLSDTDWQPVLNVTIPAGQYEVALFYRNTNAGADTLTAAAPSGSGWQDGDFALNVGTAGYTTLAFQALPALVGVGNASGAIVVQARDQFGNAVLPSYEQTIYLYGPASGQFATSPGGPWDITSVNMPAGTGTATFYYRDTLPGVSKTLTASDQTPLDTPDSGLVNAVGRLSVSSLPPSQLAFVSTAQTVTAGQISDSVVIEARQGDGSPAVLGTDLTVALASSSPNGRFFTTPDLSGTPITQAVIPAGQSQVTVYYSSQKAGDLTLAATASGLTGGTQNIKILGAASAQVRFMTAAQIHAAGDTSGQIRVQLQDQYGNPAATGQTSTIDLSTDSPSGQFSAAPGAGWSPVSSLDIAAGSSDLYFYYKDTAIGTWHLGAASGSLTPDSQTYSVQPGTAARLVLTSSAPNLVAGQPSGPLTVTVTDAFGNVTTSTVPLTLYTASSSAGARFSVDGSFTDNGSQLNLSAGQQATTFYYRDTLPGSPTLKIADLALPDSPDHGLTNATQTATIAPGTAHHLTLHGPEFQVAGGVTALTLTLKNQFDVPLAATDDTTVHLTTTSGGDFSLSNFGAAAQTAIIPTGSSEITVYYRDTGVGTANLVARDEPSGADTGLGNAGASVTMLPGDLARLRFVAPAPQLEAGEISGPLAIQTEDAFGNVVVLPDDLTVYLASSSSGGSFGTSSGFTGGVSQVLIPSGASGATVYYRDLQTGSPALTASDLPAPDTPDQGIVNATLQPTITSGNIVQLVWSGLPDTAETGQVSGPITVSAQNQYGVPVAVSSDLTVYLRNTAPGNGFSSATGGPWNLSSVVIPAGQSGAVVYYRSLNAGSDTLTAADAPSGPDTGLADAAALVTVGSGTPGRIVLTNSPYTMIARHTSPPLTAELRNQFGGATVAATDTPLYLRTTSGGGEFATQAAGPWGLNFVTIPAGQAATTFYYRDSAIGTPAITVSDNLPLAPDIGLANTTQTLTITPQTVDHFLVTNIATPQYEGTPSSVVVIAQDSENYLVSDYQGTVTFTGNDSTAILPPPYTFTPADQGIHTFVNGVAFPNEGIKTVTVTDAASVTGSQTGIVVNKTPAGPIAALRFASPPDGSTLTKNAVQTINLESVDSQGRPSNAPVGGYSVRLSSDSAGGEFATTPTGPWAASLVTDIPEGLNALTVYYRDSVPGAPQLTASDWLASSDDSGITNAVLNLNVVQNDQYRLTLPASAVAGQPFTATITAIDNSGNPLTDYDGSQPVVFSGPSNAPGGQQPTYPASVDFTDGVGTAQITVFGAGTQTLTATEDSLGDTATIDILPAAPTSTDLQAPGVVTAGQPFTLALNLVDAYGNPATNFSGDKNLSFSGPGNAPDSTAPSYPASVVFANGAATVSITLFRAEVVTLDVTPEGVGGDSALLNVIAAPATRIVAQSGDQQRSPVSQLLPDPLLVLVTDDFGNPVSDFAVNFGVTAGGGSLSATSVKTASDGTAQITWTLGPTPGTDNNLAEATAPGLAGSPVIFTASALSRGFLLTTPNPVTAGQSFTVHIKVVDEDGQTVTDYNGTKTLVFSGPGNAPDGSQPQYPVSVTFVNGVAQPAPDITLVAAETVSLTATEGDLTGTSLPFAVRAAPVTRLAITSPPQQIDVDTASGPLTVCAQDQYGNAAVIVGQNLALDAVSTSGSGQFATTPTGPWTNTQHTMTIGMSCVNLYYRDAAAGTHTLTISSSGISGATQAINVTSLPPPEPEPEPSPTPGPTPSPTPGIGGQSPTGSSTAAPATITLYADNPTTPTSQPSTLATTTVPLPTVPFPIITAPASNTLVTPISGDIIISGTAPPGQTVRVKAGERTFGATTTDKHGFWLLHIARQQFPGSKQTIRAELANPTIHSPTVTFTIKRPTITERIVNWWAQ